MEFKVRVLDFMAIYVKEMKRPENAANAIDTHRMIKGLIKALQVAHADKNTTLFDRIKTVLTLIARSQSSGACSDVKNAKVLMTEIVALVLKPTKDAKMH